MRKIFGAWLKGRLKELEIKQETFADLMGVSQSTVSRWIGGGRITADRLAPMATILRVRVPDIVLLAAPHDESSKVMQKVLGANSNPFPTAITPPSDQSAGTLDARKDDRPAPLPGYEHVDGYGLSVSTDVARALGGEGGPGVAMFKSSARRVAGSRVVGFLVDGGALAPAFADGVTVYVEVVGSGFPLETVVDHVVFVALQSGIVARLLRSDQDGGYALAPLDGGPTDPLAPATPIVGAVVHQRVDGPVVFPDEERSGPDPDV